MRQGRGPHDRASLTNHFPKTRPATGSGVRTRPGVQFAGVPSENSVRRDAEHDTRGRVCSPDVSKLAEAVQRTQEATEGSPFQAGAKAFLEHNIQLNLVPDRFPDGLPDEVAEPADVGSEKSSDTPGSQADLQNAARLPNKPEDWPRVFERHLNAGDLDAVLELYESEARFVAPSGEMIVGRDRIREVIAELVQSKTKLTSRVVKAITLDNTTLLYTDFQGQPSMIRENETIELRFKAIELLRRQPDGTWKFIVGDPNSRGGDLS